MKKIIPLLLLWLLSSVAKADSPLTSTFFATAYGDIKLIREILDQREKNSIFNFTLREDHFKFIDDETISLDQKIALINAMGWGESPNLEKMKNHLVKKYKIEMAAFDSILIAPLYPGQELYPGASSMSNDDLCVLGYIQAMHDYFNPMNGFQCAYNAAVNNPGSEASNYVLALILAQFYFDFDWCQVHLAVRSARETGNYSEDILRPEAVDAIFSYIDLYASACAENPEIVMSDEIVNEKYTPDYWKEHPVYTKPASPQISEKKAKVDLVLRNSEGKDERMFDNWVTYDDETNGTKIFISVTNKGDVTSIVTNLQVEIFETINEEQKVTMVIQEVIPEIIPNGTTSVFVIIPDYWIFDPDADFRIKLDYDNNIQEHDENNNSDEFHEFG